MFPFAPSLPLKVHGYARSLSVFPGLEFLARDWFPGRGFVILAPVVLILFLGAGKVRAQSTRTWDGGSLLSNDWSTSFLGLNGYNWNPNGNPVAGDHLIFAGSTRTNNNNNYAAGTAFGNISFAGGAAAFTLGGNSITLNGSVTNNSSNTQTINLSFNLPGMSTFNSASGNLVQGGALSGIGGLIKEGSNLLALNNISNSYTGTTTVNAGTLRAGSTQAFGVNSAISIASSGGAVLDLNGFSNSVGSLSGGGSVLLGTATLTVGGDNTSTTFAGNISGANGSLTKVGAGTLILTADNSINGVTTIQGGTLQLGDGGTTGTLDATSEIHVGTGATFMINQSDIVIQGIDFSEAAIEGLGQLEQAGPGTTILTASNSYEGTTAVNAGTLLINGDQSAANGSVSVASGATLGGSGVIGDSSSSAVITPGAILTGGADGNGSASALQGSITIPEADAVGTLTFGGDLSVSSGSIWLVDLVQGVTPGSDRIHVGGNLAIVSGAQLNFNFADTFQLGNSYTIAQYSSLGDGLGGSNRFDFDGGIWDNGTQRTIGGGQYLINYNAGDAFNEITLTAVPEPGTFGILALTLAGLVFLRIRERRSESAVGMLAGSNAVRPD